jgi:hypothetical protein
VDDFDDDDDGDDDGDDFDDFDSEEIEDAERAVFGMNQLNLSADFGPEDGRLELGNFLEL